MADQYFEQERNSSNAHQVWCVDITLPAFGDYNELTIYLATLPIEVDGVDYSTRNANRFSLINTPTWNSNDNATSDGGQFSASNASGLWTVLTPYRNVIKKAYIVVKEALQVHLYGQATSFYVSETITEGYLRTCELPGKTEVAFTYVSDITNPDKLIAARILTSQTCVKKFNVGGLLSATVDPCGWQTAQGGNGSFCSLKKDGIDGCKAHNNEHRFGAVEEIATATITTGAGINDVGFPYDPQDPRGGVLYPVYY